MFSKEKAAFKEKVAFLRKLRFIVSHITHKNEK
jgi:hypothetical protein